MDQKTLLEKFTVEVNRCLIITPEDKAYWLGAAGGLSAEVLESVFNLVKGKNDQIDGYIKTALDNDPEHKYLNELKTQIKDLKKNTMNVEEKAVQPDAEEDLESQLKNI